MLDDGSDNEAEAIRLSMLPISTASTVRPPIEHQALYLLHLEDLAREEQRIEDEAALGWRTTAALQEHIAMEEGAKKDAQYAQRLAAAEQADANRQSLALARQLEAEEVAAAAVQLAADEELARLIGRGAEDSDRATVVSTAPSTPALLFSTGASTQASTTVRATVASAAQGTGQVHSQSTGTPSASASSTGASASVATTTAMLTAIERFNRRRAQPSNNSLKG
jgi:hypothetical protein